MLKRHSFNADEAASLLWTWDYGRGAEMDERYFRRLWGRSADSAPVVCAADEFDPVELDEGVPPVFGGQADARRIPFAPFILPAGFNPKTLPVRPRLLGSRFSRGLVTYGVGAPGVSKSTLSILSAAAIITGRELTGEPLFRTGRALIHNNEDTEDELLRRVAAMALRHRINLDELSRSMFLSSGVGAPLALVRRNRGGDAPQVAGPCSPCSTRQIERSWPTFTR